MSREILFRGKSAGNKEWIKDGEWVEGLPMYTVNKSEKGKIDRILTLRDGHYSILLIDPETVCQYTGLTDSTTWEQLSESEQENFLTKWNYKEKRLNVKEDWNGRKIFDGDIIAFTDTYSTDSGRAEGNCIGKVVWDEKELCFYVTERLSAESWEVLQDCYVIGNIFDNPEFLE